MIRLFSLGAAVVALGTGAASMVWAQQSDGTALVAPSLGVAQSDILSIDRDLLFRQSLYGKRILSDLEAERRRLATEARKVDAALAAEEKRLTEERPSMSAEEFRVLANAFDEKVKSLREERPVQEQEFSRQFEQERVSYFEKIGAILGEIVRERGGVVILDRRAILLTTQNIDITDAAIARIDEQLGDGKPTEQPQTEPLEPAETVEN